MKLPGELLESLATAPGFERNAFTKVHEHPAPVVSVRLNPFKQMEQLPELASEKVPWSSFGYYLSERPFFTFDPQLHAGAYYVQEASSMFLEQAIRQTVSLNEDLRVLDACAAPGGKSTLLQSIISSTSLLVSNEVIKARVNILSENLTKWGAVNTIVTNNDPRDFVKLPGFFDVVVVDAPCSGSGLFRRDPSALDEWSQSQVELCAQRQKRILTDLLSTLRENGVLIYSTCSYSIEEDEAIADWLISEYSLEPIQISLEAHWNIVESMSAGKAWGYRFYPDRLKGEGFYIACFRKTSDTASVSQKIKKPVFEKMEKREREACTPLIKQSQVLSYWKLGDRLFVSPENLEEDFKTVFQNLYIRKGGVCIGKFSGKEIIPDHELALSTLASDSIVSISLNLESALQYLRREQVTIDSQLRGWALVKYRGLNLGWVKLLGNRVNNYYPKEWRILKSAKN